MGFRSQEFSRGPELLQKSGRAALRLDYETRTGAYAWKTVRFVSVAAIVFTAWHSCTPEQMSLRPSRNLVRCPDRGKEGEDEEIAGGKIMKVDVERWVEEHQRTLASSGVTAMAVPRDPAHDDRPKSGQSIRLSRQGEMAEVIIWDSGECEVLRGSDPRAVTVAQRAIVSQQDLDLTMNELLQRLLEDRTLG